MNYKKIMWIQWAVIIIAVLAFLQVQSCNNRKLAIATSAVDSLTLANQTLDSMVNTQGKTVYTQKAIITNNQKSIKTLTDSIFKLKNKYERRIKEVRAYYTQRTSVRVDSFPVAYTDTVTLRKFKDLTEFYNFAQDSMITVPRTAQVDSPYFNIKITIAKNNLTINHLEFTDSQYVRIVENKGGFFRKVNGKLKFHVKKSVEFQTFHTNPYLHVTGQNSVIYTPPPKARWLERGALLGAGVALGLLL